MANVDGLIGQKIGNYRITRLLGEGGMGAVYLGENPKIESKVAIKILHPVHGVDSSMVKRFMGEARAVNRVGHPGIVRIHDFGDEEGVGTYLVMEFLEGRSLRDELRARGRLPAMEVANILSQAAAALGEVHKKGIIHRDLKPDNMFLVPELVLPGGTRVKILDFGIAKLTEDSPSMGSSTMTGVVFGSPSYMSHEQCCDTKNVDLRTDIYSLGVIGYELLGGKLPYKAESLGDLVRKQLMEVPPPPSLGADDASTMTEALDRVVLRALSVQPDDRFSSMEELVTAIHLALDGVPPEALDEDQGDEVPGLTQVDVPGSRTEAISIKPQVKLSDMATVPPRGRQESQKPKKSTTPGVGAVGTAQVGQEAPSSSQQQDEVTDRVGGVELELLDSEGPGLARGVERGVFGKVLAAVALLAVLALGAWGISSVMTTNVEQKTMAPAPAAAVIPKPAPASPGAPMAHAGEPDSGPAQAGRAPAPADTEAASLPDRVAKKRRGAVNRRRAQKAAASRRRKQRQVKAPKAGSTRPPGAPPAPAKEEQPFRSLGGSAPGTKPAREETPFNSISPEKKRPVIKRPEKKQP